MNMWHKQGEGRPYHLYHYIGDECYHIQLEIPFRAIERIPESRFLMGIYGGWERTPYFLFVNAWIYFS
jgi:hypothetical protein